MGLNRNEPIPETYDELQGLPCIEEAFYKRTPSFAADQLVVRTTLQCIELLCMSCQNLCDRQLRLPLPSHSPRFHQHAAWHEQLIRYAVSISDYAASTFCAPNSKTPVTYTDAIKGYLTSHSQVCQIYRDYLTKHPLVKWEVVNGVISNVDASSVHLFKNIYLTVRCLLTRLARLRVPENVAAKMDDWLCTSALRLAHERPSVKNDTYFSQFRVLHQVPELLARCVREQIEELLRLSPSAARGSLILVSIRDGYRLVSEATRVMTNLMIPSEYHQIRRNLGVTSGSQSTELGRHFLGSNLNALEKWAADAKGPQAARLLAMTMAFQVRSEALCWQDFHLSFPRNALGARTRSLINSPDVVKTPLNWRDAAAAALVDRMGAGSHANSGLITPNAELAGAEHLDDILMELTAAITRENFPDVENRTGIYAARPHT